MTASIYVDGSGRPKGGFGWFVKETCESHYERSGDDDDITNNQAEYMAVISAIKHAHSKLGEEPYRDGVAIYSDSLVIVKQLNHEYAINDDRLRELAREAWLELAKFDEHGGANGGLRSSSGGNPRRPTIVWIRRGENLAGKMLGS